VRASRDKWPAVSDALGRWWRNRPASAQISAPARTNQQVIALRLTKTRERDKSQVAAGGNCLADIAMLRAEPELFELELAPNSGWNR